MFAVAKLFQNGQSQAVRLPKEFRFENQKEVIIKKIGEQVVLIPKNNDVWDVMFSSLERCSSDFMETREQGKQVREDLF
jgi:antitoxin VapB